MLHLHLLWQNEQEKVGWTARVGWIHSFVQHRHHGLWTTGLVSLLSTISLLLTNCGTPSIYRQWQGSTPQVPNCGNLCPPYTLTMDICTTKTRPLWKVKTQVKHHVNARIHCEQAIKIAILITHNHDDLTSNYQCYKYYWKRYSYLTALSQRFYLARLCYHWNPQNTYCDFTLAYFLEVRWIYAERICCPRYLERHCNNVMVGENAYVCRKPLAASSTRTIIHAGFPTDMGVPCEALRLVGASQSPGGLQKVSENLRDFAKPLRLLYTCIHISVFPRHAGRGFEGLQYT